MSPKKELLRSGLGAAASMAALIFPPTEVTRAMS